jgi:uncharacterized protein with HEPN domain
VQSWIVRHLQIIGEVARALPDSIRARAPEVPSAKIIGMRHILVHDYFGIDTDIVWDVVERDLPGLKRQLWDLLAAIQED